jgi:catechol 2,3-dioxygenase
MEETMVRLKELGHILLRVLDLDRSKKFYSEVLGFKVLEEDPEHGGTFMALEGQSHAIDLFQVKDPDAALRQTPGVRGLGHIAFRVEREEDLKDAYASLQQHGVEITRTIDHVSQKSIYFNDPDGNTLEIYYELPDALAIFARGREDRDVPLVLDR